MYKRQLLVQASNYSEATQWLSHGLVQVAQAALPGQPISLAQPRWVSKQLLNLHTVSNAVCLPSSPQQEPCALAPIQSTMAIVSIEADAIKSLECQIQALHAVVTRLSCDIQLLVAHAVSGSPQGMPPKIEDP